MTAQDAQKIFDEALSDLGFEPASVIVVSGFRWTLSDRPGLGAQMIKIERRVQQLTGRPIDLRLQPKKDKNRRFDRNYLRGIEKL